MAEDEPKESWGWTRSQRIGLAILLSILLIFVAIQLIRRPALLSEPAVSVDGKPIVLPTRIDPNIATAAELSRIPHIGQTLAQKIIDYREARRQTTADGIVFRAAEDLGKIPGIGPKLVEQFRPYLQFPDDPATRS